MFHRLRWFLVPALAALVMIPFAASTRAEETAVLPTTDQALVLRNATRCDCLQPQITKGGFTDPAFIMSDAHLIANCAGARLCLFWDQLAEMYSVWLIN